MVSVPISVCLPLSLAISSQSLWCLSLSLSPPVSGYLFSVSIMSVPNSVGLSPVSSCLFSISMVSVPISVAPPPPHTHLWLALLNLYGVCPYLCWSPPCLFSISMVSACPCHCRSLACLISISVVSVPTSTKTHPVSRGLAINNIFIHVFSVLSEPEEDLQTHDAVTTASAQKE